jgi:prevent-host-death family protein
MNQIIPISDLQSSAKRYVDQVRKTERPVIVTQRGRPAAVLVSYEEFEGFEATRDEMGFPDWRARLARAEKESRQGKALPLDAYLKKRRK